MPNEAGSRLRSIGLVSLSNADDAVAKAAVKADVSKLIAAAPDFLSLVMKATA
jgi:hypothetical protein